MKSSSAYIVVGLGPTGLACVRYLKRQGHDVAVTDSRMSPPCLQQLKQEFPDIKVALGGFPEKLFNEAERIVMSPGVSLQEPAIQACVARGVPTLGDIELFAEAAKAPIVAITGSNGKTTVTTLVGEMIKQAGHSVSVCGNIGEQVLAELEKPVPDFYVLELSSFQLETVHTMRSKAAVVLNISPDHMDRYDALKDYTKAKQRIYHLAEHAIINLDEPKIWQNLSLSKDPIGFSVKLQDDKCFCVREYQGKSHLAFGQQCLMQVDQLALQGMHHVQNALAALALGYAIGLEFAPMCEVLQSFKGLPHRCQWVANVAGVDWFNDSKGTNVGASIAAIDTLSQQIKGKLILLAGGDGKQADFAPLGQALAGQVTHIFLYGQDAKHIANVVPKDVGKSEMDSLDAAVQAAAKLAEQGDVVLLSPACASFDMFDNYEHRGEVFMQLVKSL